MKEYSEFGMIAELLLKCVMLLRQVEAKRRKHK